MTATRTGGTRTARMVTAALVVALMAAAAWITIPLGAVPLTLQVFVVVLAALLLEPLWAAAAMAVYLGLGAAGLPIFSGAQGGLGVVAGPTGGYLIGFLVGAPLGALVRRLLASRSSLLADVAAAATVIVSIYAVGTVRLAAVAGLTPAQAVAAGVVPFIVIDIAKAAVAVVIAMAVRRARGIA